MVITTNDLKKGTRIQMRNGWFGTLQDNRKGNIRTAEVEGKVTETGDVYAHDIACALIGEEWHYITHTPEQIEVRKLNQLLGL